MKIKLNRQIILLVLVLCSLSVLFGCAESDDDDDSGGGAISSDDFYDRCISLYKDCYGYSESQYEGLCDLYQEKDFNDCEKNLYNHYFNCIDSKIDCNSPDSEAVGSCGLELSRSLPNC